jgi:hypothetical protein
MSHSAIENGAQARTPAHLGFFLIACLYAIAALWGVTQARAPDNDLLELLTAVSMPLAATLWTVNDARCRGEPLLHIVQIVMLFTWPLAVPIYLVRSRRLRGVGLAILHALGLIATMLLTFNLTLLIMM